MIQKRCVEQLYPASDYSLEDIRKKIAKQIKFYPKKTADIEINLNEDGIYVAKISFLFEENLSIKEKLKFLNIEKFKEMTKRSINLIRKPKKTDLKVSKLSQKNKINKEEKFEKININTNIKKNRAIEKYMQKDLKNKKIRKSKYEKYIEEKRVLKPI